MKLKTYHSESVEAAVRLAGVELGDDAIFLGSREKPREQGGAGYEVTFALMETPAVGAEVEPETRAAGQVPSPVTAVRPQGIATRPRATSHKDTRQAAAPPPFKIDGHRGSHGGRHNASECVFVPWRGQADSAPALEEIHPRRSGCEHRARSGTGSDLKRIERPGLPAGGIRLFCPRKFYFGTSRS